MDRREAITFIGNEKMQMILSKYIKTFPELPLDGACVFFLGIAR